MIESLIDLTHHYTSVLVSLYNIHYQEYIIEREGEYLASSPGRLTKLESILLHYGLV